MSELTPYPFAALVHRMFRELERRQAVFDLPRSRFFLGRADRDLSVGFHGHRASSPLGPAAGPQTQMAQNLVLSWLGGCRIMELKTVQIMDELEIPRPCIDMRTVGFNAEWSQELKLDQSLEEYVKGAMLVEMLRSSGHLSLAEGFDDVVWDMSVGYDLAGVRSPGVRAFLDGMLDPRPVIDRLRAEIPPEYAALADLDYPRRLSDTVTLSTFHGCPPDEIEAIIDFLLRELGVHCVIKFNPMLLGPEVLRGLLHDELGYDNVRVPDTAFERDTRWEQAVDMVGRLEETARSLGLGLGVKFTNTLIVENTHGFLPAEEKEVYLSGQPLHVLAMHLVRRFRRVFGDRLPISFSAGIDRSNFADAAALGLVPVTVCSDLLRKGGYGRLQGYYGELLERMDAVGARSLDGFVLRAYGLGAAALEKVSPAPEENRRAACLDALAAGGDPRASAGEELWPRWVAEARLLNTEHYVPGTAADPRYALAGNSTPPRKIGSHLELFECVTCDLCVPVCPNDANFTFLPPLTAIPVVQLEPSAQGWTWNETGNLPLTRRHQIANFADFCNDCGNCDVFCPEDGGPYAIKPRFFGSERAWTEAPEADGFFIERSPLGDRVLGRFSGRDYRLSSSDRTMRFVGHGFEVRLERDDPARDFEVESDGPIDLTYCFIMDCLRQALLDGDDVTYVNSLGGYGGPEA